MGGGLMQLVAYGAQDVYLTGNPQITFFKVVYRRHTNFSVETIEHAVDSAKPGGRYTVTVHRNGDLATNCALRVKVPALSSTDLGSSTSVAWVFFRSQSITDGIHYLANMIQGISFYDIPYTKGLTYIGSMVLLDWVNKNDEELLTWKSYDNYLFLILFWAVLYHSIKNQNVNFIYFQF